MEKRTGKVNAGRLFEALGKIGYSPDSAILDIVDNSVAYGASKVQVEIKGRKIKLDGAKREKTVVDRFVIKDNGNGMDEASLDNAIGLGSKSTHYGAGTLSKFGLGLKSASSSLGKRLTVITTVDGNKFIKGCVDQDLLGDEYEYEFGSATDEEVSEIKDFLGDSTSGTFVIIEKPRLDSLPSIAEILTKLKEKSGVIFYYYLTGQVPEREKVSILIDDHLVEGFDPLHIAEISEDDGDLNETTWDGKSVKWITRTQAIQVSEEHPECLAMVEITQLPHPPTVGKSEQMTAAQCREKYMIGAGNYGIYVYRNYRLISWASSLDVIQQDQDLYSFRGRLFITSDSDDVLNIDVTKSRIQLSDLARTQLTPDLNEAKRKSIAAWKNRGRLLDDLTKGTPHTDINDFIDRIDNELQKDEQIDEDLSEPEEKKNIRDKKKKLVESKPTTAEENKKVEESNERVQYVDSLTNNQLWERGHDPKHGLIVRVNRSHRLIREVVDSQSNNSSLIKLLDTLFFGLARGEYRFLYSSDHKISIEKMELILDDYREHVGSELSELIKRIGAKNILNGFE